jgi:hypothetical protein
MADVNQFHEGIFDEFQPKKKLSDMLNVLTILTFIASGLSFLYAPYTYATVCKQAALLSEKMDQYEEKGGFLAGVMKGSMEALNKNCEMRLPILISTIVCLILCVIGAILMRRLKKSGYFIYLIGEIAMPIIVVTIIGGSPFSIIVTFLFPILFLILYGTQLKNLK